MLALARLALKGPYNAAAVVGLLAVLSVFIPLAVPAMAIGVLLASICMLMSCILVGLVILTQGSAAGLKAIGVAVAGMSVAAWALIDAPEFGLWTALLQWLPIIVLAQTLRSSRSLALAILVGVLLTLVGIAAQHLWWGGFESSLVDELTLRMEEQQRLGVEIDASVMERNEQLVRLFVLGMGAMVYLVIVLVLLTARWLQAKLVNSQGFAQEFRALRLGQPAALCALGVLAASFALPQDWLDSLVFLMVIAFMFQGIAVIHDRLAPRKQARLLLSIFYALLLVFPQMVALTGLAGLLDNWLNFRKARATTNDE